MTIAPGLASGLRAPFTGLRRIAATRRTWPWVIAPALIFAALLCGALGGGVTWGPSVARAILPDVSRQPAVLRGLIVVVFDGLLMAVLTVVGWYLTAALAGPFHDRLSQILEEEAGGAQATVTGGLSGLLTDVWMSVGHTLAAMMVWLAASCALLPVQLIPVVGQATWLIGATWISALMLAWQALDYPLSRRRLVFAQKIALVRANLWAVSGLGLASLAILAVPVVNLLAPAAAVAGATLLLLEINAQARP